MVWQCTQVGDLKGALRALEQAMALSEEIGDRSHDADVLGEIADTFADMGDFEQAAQVSISNQVSCSCQSVYAERLYMPACRTTTGAYWQSRRKMVFHNRAHGIAEPELL